MESGERYNSSETGGGTHSLQSLLRTFQNIFHPNVSSNNSVNQIDGILNLTEQELKNKSFINQFIKSLKTFMSSLKKMSDNISPEKNYNELVGIFVLCNKLEIDIINSETPEKRISIIKDFSENLKKKINAIPDEYKTQVNKREVVNLLEGFLSDISNARNRIKNK